MNVIIVTYGHAVSPWRACRVWPRTPAPTSRSSSSTTRPPTGRPRSSTGSTGRSSSATPRTRVPARVQPGVEASSGRVVVLLNNDAVVEAGALAAAAAALDNVPGAGLVGGALMAVNGRLRRPAALSGQRLVRGLRTGRRRRRLHLPLPTGGRLRLRPFLATTPRTSTSLVASTPLSPPPTARTSTFCLRAPADGHRVIYDPAPGGGHLEHGSGTVTTARSSMLRSRDRLRERHLALLAERPVRSVAARLEARSPRRRRILVIDDRVPWHQSGSGAPPGRRPPAHPRRPRTRRDPVPHAPLRRLVGRGVPDVPRDVEVVVVSAGGGPRCLPRSRPGFFDDVVVSRPRNIDCSSGRGGVAGACSAYPA